MLNYVITMLHLIPFFKPLECQGALGMSSGAITDGQITASSEADNDLNPAHQGRLGTERSWSAGKNDANQWLQVYLIILYRVTRVATQGRNDADEWVTKYQLQYSNDTWEFQSYKEPGQNNDKVKWLNSLKSILTSSV